MKIFVLQFTSVLAVAAINHGYHGHGGGSTGTGVVDAAIVNIELHYSHKLCRELLKVDCTTHVTKGDEQVCGSDGVTYENHCRFVHAVCRSISPHNPLKVASHGACPTGTSTVTAGPFASNTLPPATVPPAASTDTPATSVGMTTTTMMMTTATTEAATTADPFYSFAQNVFCTNVGGFSCTSELQILCGSDGQFYPNPCELSKQKCLDPTLTIADRTTCAMPGS